MYRKYLEHMAMAAVRYFFNYDHDLKSQLLVVISLITLFISQVMAKRITLKNNISKILKNIISILNEVGKEKNESVEETGTPAHNYIKKDILAWRLKNG